MVKRILDRLWSYLFSLQLAIICLSLLMLLVVLCTFAQVDLGTHGAVTKYMRSLFVWWHPGGGAFRLPVLPGGALVGGVLTVNLLLATVKRLELRWRKAGLWIIHVGLILLVAGEFISGAFQRDMILAFVEGQTVNYLETPTEVELTLVDTTDATTDDVYAVPGSHLVAGRSVALPGSPVSLKVKAFYPNSALRPDAKGPTLATAGLGADLQVESRPMVTATDQTNLASAYVEPVVNGQGLGTFLVSEGLNAPQTFSAGGRSYAMDLRFERRYLPYALTLKKASHDLYAGTEIPKNYSSLVQLVNAGSRESREVLISMNQPLRYDGKAFYQYQMGGPRGDRQSVLQVVENPGWMLPYLSCALVALGLLTHFGVMLVQALGRRGREA